jgi:nanoRNase/pAp phosphatase (c-di-AMP/oligoRNAs hydrolase)
MKSTRLIQRILEEIRASETICVVGHIRPDGDCIGSQIGLAMADGFAESGEKSDLLESGCDAAQARVSGSRPSSAKAESEFALRLRDLDGLREL